MSFFDRRRRVPLDPPSWTSPSGSIPLRFPSEVRSDETPPAPSLPAYTIPDAPHCNGQHGTTRICEWCDAVAGLVTALRHEEGARRALETRLRLIEYYLGIRRDGDGGAR